MSLRRHTETAVDAVFQALSASPTPEQRKQVSEIIEATLIEAVRESCKQSSSAALDCCEADRDMAHKIAGGIEQRQQALIANLQGLR